MQVHLLVVAFLFQFLNLLHIKHCH